MAMRPVVVIFGRDLRLRDNPALAAAAAAGAPIIPLFVLDENDPASPVGAARWWLHRSLEALSARLSEKRLRLVFRRGGRTETAVRIARETGAAAVLWNRRYDCDSADRELIAALMGAGARAERFNGSLLCEPDALKTGAGRPYGVFTPFWRALRAIGPAPAPPPEIAAAAAAPETPYTDELADWRLLPSKPDWAAAFPETWTPGEIGADAALARFLDGAAADYSETRDFPGVDGVSRLSPHLAFGEISPAAVWRAVMARVASGALAERHAEKFLAELGWREFARSLLHHYPEMATTPLRPEFAAFPWRDDAAAFDAWKRGRTGYPIVDAGMRELWRTGWMHNRVRMITASFLVKDLLISWREGERWFRNTLVDADVASNSMNWQWVAGCGADAAPFFRIFNPVTQGEKFDPDGAYVRRFVPELAQLPDAFIHRPWQAPEAVLAKAGVKLGKTYPAPIVDHGAARTRALEIFRTLPKR